MGMECGWNISSIGDAYCDKVFFVGSTCIFIVVLHLNLIVICAVF